MTRRGGEARFARLLRLGTRFYLAAAIVVVYLALVLYGLVFAHGTGPPDVPYPTRDDVRHLLHALAGGACGALALLPHWRSVEKWTYGIYLAVLAALVAVLVVGPDVRGTRRWLDLGFTRFQVSEVAKIAVVLALARYLKATRDTQSLRTSLWALAIMLAAVLLIAKEPDLGTALLFPPVLFLMLFVARGRLAA